MAAATKSSRIEMDGRGGQRSSGASKARRGAGHGEAEEAAAQGTRQVAWGSPCRGTCMAAKSGPCSACRRLLKDSITARSEEVNARLLPGSAWLATAPGAHTGQPIIRKQRQHSSRGPPSMHAGRRGRLACDRLLGQCPRGNRCLADLSPRDSGLFRSPGRRRRRPLQSRSTKGCAVSS